MPVRNDLLRPLVNRVFPATACDLHFCDSVPDTPTYMPIADLLPSS